jgi:hypothetical protein
VVDTRQSAQAACATRGALDLCIKMIALAAYPNHPGLRKECKPGFGRIYRISTPKSARGRRGYVGLNTTTLCDRLGGHFVPNSRCRKLRNALAKHGREAFGIEVVEDNIPVQNLKAREIHWVAVFDSHCKGYNCTPGGESNPMDDEETRARHKEKMSDPEFIKKTVAKRKITFATPEFKERASIAHKKAWENPESKEKLSHSLKVFNSLPGAQDSRRTLSTEMWQSEQHRQDAVDAMKRAHKDPAVKKAKSKTTAAMWQDPEWVAKRNASHAEARKKPGHFERHSAASKRAWTPERRASHGAKCRETKRCKALLAAQVQ